MTSQTILPITDLYRPFPLHPKKCHNRISLQRPGRRSAEEVDLISEIHNKEHLLWKKKKKSSISQVVGVSSELPWEGGFLQR